MKKRSLIVIFALLTAGAAAFYLISARPWLDSGGEAPIKDEFELLPVRLETISTVNFSFEGGRKFKSPVYVDACRYYFALDDVVELLGGTYSRHGDQYTALVNGSEYTFDLTQARLQISPTSSDTGSQQPESKEIELVDMPVEKDGKIYTCMSNFTRAFNLDTSWDLENNSVCFWKSRRTITPKGSGNQAAGQTGHEAYLRLEDVYCNGKNIAQNADDQTRLRAIADLLYENGVPFHVAWIPRCVFPDEELDNNPETDWNICNAGFIYTLDYLQYRGGSIGLHGYTHSSGNQKTAIGTDFGPNANTTAEEAQQQLNKAKEAAIRLKIPYSFFEFPHYAATETQLMVAEKNFKILYQKYTLHNNKHDVRTDNETLFVGTPLGYLSGVDSLDDFLNNTQTLLNKGTLASFFFHPHIEDGWIDPVRAVDGYPDYIYKIGSPLRHILSFFAERNYHFRYVFQIGGS